MALMQSLIKSEGYCCVFGYLIANREKSATEIADHLGISSRLIRRLKVQIHNQELTCERVETCRYRKTSSSTSGTGNAFSTSR